MLEPRKAVSAVRWNPRRDSEVAVAFWHWAEVRRRKRPTDVSITPPVLSHAPFSSHFGSRPAPTLDPSVHPSRRFLIHASTATPSSWVPDPEQARPRSPIYTVSHPLTPITHIIVYTYRLTPLDPHNTHQVYVYDLETWSSAPTRVHRVGHRVKGAAGGNYSLAFVTTPPAAPPRGAAGNGGGGGGFTTLVAGSAYGVLRGWGALQPDAVAWEVRTRGNGGTLGDASERASEATGRTRTHPCIAHLRPSNPPDRSDCTRLDLSALLTPPPHRPDCERHTAITALCPCADGLLVGATASPEALYVWDVANLQTPILGATPSPPLLHAIDVHGWVGSDAACVPVPRRAPLACRHRD